MGWIHGGGEGSGRDDGQVCPKCSTRFWNMYAPIGGMCPPCDEEDTKRIREQAASLICTCGNSKTAGKTICDECIAAKNTAFQAAVKAKMERFK